MILVLLMGLVSFIPNGNDINYNPKPLKKDISKIWETEQVELHTISVPDSLYNDMLLDKGRIYGLSSGIDYLGFAYVGRIYSCRSGGCGMDDNVSMVSIDDDFEYFDYYILFDEALEVEKVRVYNYQATHGHEVGGKGWLKQFIGYKGNSKLEYGKNIDSISGATISANAITYNVMESHRYLDLIKSILLKTEADLKVMITE